MSQSNALASTVTDRMRWSLAHIIFVLQQWEGKASIFDRSWDEKGADITMYCDIALPEHAVAGSFGKGTFLFPSGNYAFSKYEQVDLDEAWREKKHSTAHLELLNMLVSVLSFSSKEQKIMCFCDNKAAIKIAKARYSAVNNLAMERLLQIFDIECLKRNLSVRFRWQCREDPLPKVADALSRGEVLPIVYMINFFKLFELCVHVYVCFIYFHGNHLFMFRYRQQKGWQMVQLSASQVASKLGAFDYIILLEVTGLSME